MNRDISFFNLSINKILSKDQSALDKARIRLLYYGFWIVGVAVFGLFTSVYFQRQTLLTITAGILFVSFLGLFKYLTYRPNWKQISHAVLIIGSIVNINTIFIALQKVDIITVQELLLIVLFSYYMLGQRLGPFLFVVEPGTGDGIPGDLVYYNGLFYSAAPRNNRPVDSHYQAYSPILY